MSGELRIQTKRKSKTKCGYEVEKRDDGFYYVVSVPSRKSSVKPGDRVLEINGVRHTAFKTAKRANDLLDILVLDVEPQEDSDTDSGSEYESERPEGSESEDSYSY